MQRNRSTSTGHMAIGLLAGHIPLHSCGHLANQLQRLALQLDRRHSSPADPQNSIHAAAQLAATRRSAPMYACVALLFASVAPALAQTQEYCLSLQQLFCNIAAADADLNAQLAAIADVCIVSPVAPGACTGVDGCDTVLPPVGNATADCCVQFDGLSICQEVFVPAPVEECCEMDFGSKTAECLFPCLTGATKAENDSV